MVVRTYAPRGQTPVLHAPLSWEHLSVMGALTTHGHLHTLIQDRSVNGQDVVRFLRYLLRCLPGKLLVVWDGLPAHRGQAVKDFLTQGGAGRIELKRLPAYAPELNPTEGIWSYLKRVELKNRVALISLLSAMNYAKPSSGCGRNLMSWLAVSNNQVSMFSNLCQCQ